MTRIRPAAAPRGSPARPRAATGGTGLRVIAGTARGIRLQVPPGWTVRPTSDRVREALFSRLVHDPAVDLPGATVLDGFAGSGALGIEALSRGAAQAVFLETDAAAVAAITANLAATRLAVRAVVHHADALAPPPLAPAQQPASLVLLDPPYGQGLIVPALAALAAAGWLAPRATVVAEMDAARPEPLGPGMAIIDQRRYGDTLVVVARCGPSPG